MGKEYQTNAQYSMILFVLIFLWTQTMIDTSQGVSATGIRTRIARHVKTKKLQPAGWSMPNILNKVCNSLYCS